MIHTSVLSTSAIWSRRIFSINGWCAVIERSLSNTFLSRQAMDIHGCCSGPINSKLRQKHAIILDMPVARLHHGCQLLQLLLEHWSCVFAYRPLAKCLTGRTSRPGMVNMKIPSNWLLHKKGPVMKSAHHDNHALPGPNEKYHLTVVWLFYNPVVNVAALVCVGWKATEEGTTESDCLPILIKSN